MSLPRTTHPWIQPFYDALEGRGIRQPQIGSPTGTVGLYGATGILPIATGGNLILGATFVGASGFGATGVGASGLYTHLARFADNGGSGTPYTHGDVVSALKRLGAIPQ